jgi:hypothetical protein
MFTGIWENSQNCENLSNLVVGNKILFVGIEMVPRLLFY